MKRGASSYVATLGPGLVGFMGHSPKILGKKIKPLLKFDPKIFIFRGS